MDSRIFAELFLAQKNAAPRWLAILRGTALFFGLFTLVNLAGEILLPGFDANIWWIDMRWLPSVTSSAGLAIFGMTLLAFGIFPLRSRGVRVACALIFSAAAGAACLNLMEFELLLARGVIRTMWVFPFSALVCVWLCVMAFVCFRKKCATHSVSKLRHFSAFAVCVCCALAFPVLQMFFFGKTDYQRPADAAIVFGARVYRDGRLSDALADRVRTACELYRSGLTKKLIMSGGPGDGAIDEPSAMKRMAIKLGVNEGDILLDRHGLNTFLTIQNTQPLLAQMRARRVMVVSHFYHLPRIKLTYARAGREVLTVPARETYLLGQLPFNMAREVAALWVYYLRPIASIA